MSSKAFQVAAPLAAMIAILGAGVVSAQDQPITQSGVKINLPNNSPLTFVSTIVTDSRATARGAALMLDLHMSLTLKNGSSRRIHGVTLRVVAQEGTLGGKGSVTYPNPVEPGGLLPVRIDMQLL